MASREPPLSDPAETREELARRVKELRFALPPKRAKAKHLNQDEFGELLRDRDGQPVKRPTIVDWEKHGREPQPRYREQFVKLGTRRLEQRKPSYYSLRGAQLLPEEGSGTFAKEVNAIEDARRPPLSLCFIVRSGEATGVGC